MTISIEFEGAKDQEGKTETFLLCSNTEWHNVVEWVREDISEQVCPLLHHLVKNGSVKDTFALDVELELALDEYPPPMSIRKVVETLMSDMGAGAEDETLTILHE